MHVRSRAVCTHSGQCKGRHGCIRTSDFFFVISGEKLNAAHQSRGRGERMKRSICPDDAAALRGSVAVGEDTGAASGIRRRCAASSAVPPPPGRS
jgi:hypothetical protein